MFLSRSLPSILKKADYKNNGGCVIPACSSFFPCKYISFVFQDCKYFICLLKFCTIFLKKICVLAKKSDFRCRFCERSMAKTKKACAFWRPVHHIVQHYCEIALVLSVNICLHLSLASGMQMTEMSEGSTFCYQTPWFTFALIGDRQFVGNTEQLSLCCNYRSSRPDVSVEKLLSKKFSKLTGKSCARFSFLIKLLAEVCNFILKETRAQGSSCKFCEISKNNFLLQNTSCGCFCNYKKTDITCPLQTYPCTCNAEKKLISSVSCTENCFC